MQTINASTKTNVSIQISALDALMNLAGELVLGRNQLLQAIGSDNKRLLETTSQRIDMVTSEIQEKIMRTRMQPMGTLFDKIAQVVRELAPRSGKQVDISVIGEDVGLMVDRIGNVVTVEPSEVDRPPENIGEISGRCFYAVFKTENKLVGLMSMNTLFQYEI